MAITKLFPENVDVDKIQQTSLLEGTLCTYYFSVLFTNFTICNLYVLNAQLNGGNWHQLITTRVADNDGEITIQIGNFVPGTIINMIFGIQALSDIPSVAVFIVNKTTNTIVKIVPKTGKKKLNTSETWNAPINSYPLQA